MQKRHIAVVGPMQSPREKDLKFVYRTLTHKVGSEFMKIHPDLGEVVEAIRAGSVLGVIVPGAENDEQAEDEVRRALGPSGSDCLPVCKALPASASFADYAEIISGAAKRKPPQKEFGKYAVESGRGTLEERMRVPKKELKVVIMDDDVLAIRGMREILEGWKNIVVEFIEQKGVEMRPMPDADIVLLDHSMGDVDGGMVAIKLAVDGFQGVIASISMGSCPAYATFHFDGKDSMQRTDGTGESEKHRFVAFVNNLIELAESPQS